MFSIIARRVRRPLAALAICAAAGSAAVAQDDHPDFTGVWSTYGGDPASLSLTPPPTDIPLTPAAQAKRDAYLAVTEGTDESPGGYCVGAGMPEVMMRSGVYPMEIIQRPEQITVIYELHGVVRRIYLDARAEQIEDVFPEHIGFSVGRWEGDALVVETTLLTEQVDTHYPHSAEARIREEYRLSTETDGRKVLTAQMTLTDPAFLTRPYTAEKKWQAVPEGRLMTYDCMAPVWLDVLDGLLEGGDESAGAPQ